MSVFERILAIETSCDETAAAVVAHGRTIMSNVVASQIDIHRRYGGVVPEVASRQHILSIEQVVRTAIEALPNGWSDIDAVAATYGPGLSGALLTGLNTAKSIAWARGLPLIGVNHVEAHMYGAWLTEREPPPFPCVALIVSGGHTLLVLMRDHGQAERLGGTLDDAAGEAFDKVARLLELGFPGGPAIQRSAVAPADSNQRLPRAWLHGTYDFSFSGLKTAVLHEMQAARSAYGDDGDALSRRQHELAYLFQESVVDILTRKTRDAVTQTGAKAVILAGGVAANTRLREVLVRRAGVPVYVPPINLCTDNAAMIAACAYWRPQVGDLAMTVDANLAFV
jgi:N6-L-threonylcarbamoyladenine synthase